MGNEAVLEEVAATAKRLAKNNKARVRPSSVIKEEMERAKLGLRAARNFLSRSEQALADAERRLKAANERLAAIKASGRYNPMLKDVQALIGFSRHSKVFDKPVFHPGVVQQQEEIIAAETRRIPARRDAVAREEARLGAVLKGLESELRQAQQLEDALDGRVRVGTNVVRKVS
jgi:predicted  nucleic acid-binding Zn-ribbon protein